MSYIKDESASNGFLQDSLGSGHQGTETGRLLIDFGNEEVVVCKRLRANRAIINIATFHEDAYEDFSRCFCLSPALLCERGGDAAPTHST